MNWTYIVVAAVLAIVAGFLASIDAALSTFSKARADELAGEGRGGARRLAQILEDPAPAINSMLLLRVIAETTAAVLAALIVASHVDELWR
ncbi:MAG: CNNM domain-containing protein, partial [Aeromicrobium sp.]